MIPSSHLLATVVRHAFLDGAHEIVIDEEEGGGRVAVRQDGVLRTACTLDAPSARAVVVRLRRLAGVRLGTEQGEGTFEDYGVRVRGRFVPRWHGERVVLLMEQGNERPLWDDAEGARDYVDHLRDALERDGGLAIVQGRRGSGVTTFIRDMAERVDAGVSGTAEELERSLRSRAHWQFCDARPLHGETIDTQRAIQAAMQGRGVMLAVPFGWRPAREIEHVVSRVFRAAITLHLVPMVCGACREVVMPNAGIQQQFAVRMPGGDSGTFALYQGRGCDRCAGRGWYGRRGVLGASFVQDGLDDLFAASEADAQKRLLAGALSGTFAPQHIQVHF